jgi:hypothetical protein
VSRADHEPSQYYDNEYDDCTPTYRSPSLFRPESSSQNTALAVSPANGRSAPAKTFADMARRFCPNNTESESEQIGQSSAPVAGIVKLQPHRKIGHNSWRPMQASVLSEAYGAGLENVSIPSTSENMEHLLSLRHLAPSAFLTASQRRGMYHHPAVPVETLSRSENLAPVIHRADRTERPFTLVGIGQQDTAVAVQPDVNSQYTELFGSLPDPIRLHEQLGDFDGQVVFIGHPNRDVSAHQWSSASFQWENIGRYTHSRGKIEGSLASDRVKEMDASRSALACFKLAAENRERLITQNGRTDKDVADSVLPPDRPEAIHTATTHDVSRSAAKSISDHAYGIVASGQSFGESATPASVMSKGTIKKAHLDDPFVAKPRPFETTLPTCVQSSINLVEAKGSLDLEYTFPVKLNAPSRPAVKHTAQVRPQERHVQAEPDAPFLFRGGTRPFEQLAEPPLREIGFGEEAASGFAFSFRQDNRPQRANLVLSSEINEQQAKLRDHMTTFGENMKRSDTVLPAELPGQGRIAALRIGRQQPTARSLFPIMGMTIANPRRTVPPDTANPAPSNISAPGVPSKAPEPEGNTTDITPIATLRFSDPDGVRQAQEHEIVNGLSQQAPTVQNFKGPFFTESMPTTHDPTVSLSIQISEEEKLRNWFRDGHCPDRQREYALSLVSAATGCRDRSFGAVGEGSRPIHKRRTENTTPFVRLYEGLSEYIEENRSGSGGSYFTRSWKVAPSELRDLGTDGNNSYFSNPSSKVS